METKMFMLDETTFKPEYLSNYANGSTGYGFEAEQAPSSATFIKHAREDIQESTDLRSIYNAISNAKRALHRRVDTLCTIFAYELFEGKKIISLQNYYF